MITFFAKSEQDLLCPNQQLMTKKTLKSQEIEVKDLIKTFGEL